MEQVFKSSFPAEPLIGRLAFRLAEAADEPAVFEIVQDACRWLHEVKGITEQWERHVELSTIRQMVGSGELYLAIVDGQPAGTLRLNERGEEPWAERGDRALYVHELSIHRRYGGLGLGRRMLAWAEDRARRQGYDFLRLDCMAANPELRQYYTRAGFTPLGQHPVHTWYALFELKL